MIEGSLEAQTRRWRLGGSLLAFALPAVVTVLRASAGSQWRDDLALVRGLGWVPVGGEGVVSAVLTQAFSFLPIGGRVLRASLVSALALALCAFLIFRLTLAILRENHAMPRLAPVLAVVGFLDRHSFSGLAARRDRCWRRCGRDVFGISGLVVTPRR